MKLGETAFLAETGVENEPLKLEKSCDAVMKRRATTQK